MSNEFRADHVGSLLRPPALLAARRRRGEILLAMSSSHRTFPVGVIGAGIVGLATARLLAQAAVPVTVFEKESSAGTHQTGHNSGVVHAGIYYKPGSAKATMTRHGVSLLKEYCQ